MKNNKPKPSNNPTKPSNNPTKPSKPTTNTPPVVVVMNDDLMRVLAGDLLAVSTEDGGTVMLRLMTADELLDRHKAACERYLEEPTMSREQAEKLTKSFDLFEFAKNLASKNFNNYLSNIG